MPDIQLAALAFLVSLLPDLLLLLPSIRRWARRSSPVRWSMALFFGLLSFGLCLWLLVSSMAFSTMFQYFWLSPDYFHNITDNNPDHVKRDMQNYNDYVRSYNAVSDGLTQRLLLPPQAAAPTYPCYTSRALCEHLRTAQNVALSWQGYTTRLLSSVLLGLLSAASILFFTRKAKERVVIQAARS